MLAPCADRGRKTHESGDTIPTATSSTPSTSYSGLPRPKSSGANIFALGRGGAIAGKTIEEAGLRGLADTFLVAIERGNTTLHAVAPTEVLQLGDVLWFAGSTGGVITLRKIPGMSPLLLTMSRQGCTQQQGHVHAQEADACRQGKYVVLCKVKKACPKGKLFEVGQERGAVVTCSVCLVQDWRRWMTRLTN